MRILIVDDDPVSLMIIATVLKQWGHQIVEAGDGLVAWSILQREKDISLVISDWNMPRMSGLELCRNLRSGAISRYIYFILITVREDKASLLEGMEAGADDFLVKPFDRDELRVRMHAGERILQLEQHLAERNFELEQDLAAAAALQLTLLPPPASIKGILLDWLFLPGRFLAGDMFGYFSLAANHLGFYQLDVAGHGVRSALRSIALCTLLAQGLLETQITQQPIANASTTAVAPPEQVIAELNRRFVNEGDATLYFTMIYGVLDASDGRVILTQAGHPSPLWLRRQTGNIELLGTGGFPVALLPDVEYDTLSFSMSIGDRLFLYSDGVTDCTNSVGESFGQARLLDFLLATAEQSLSDCIHALKLALGEWQGDKLYQDDISLLVLERVSS